MRTKVRHLPARAATGAFILNSGLAKLQADDDTAKQLHGMASGSYPLLADVDPHTFARALAIGEITLGSALLIPIVPSSLAALGLGAFSGGLVGLYAKTPGMRQEGSVRPTSDGMALAKDASMLGIALSMILDPGAWTGGKKRKARKARKASRMNQENHKNHKNHMDSTSTVARAAKAVGAAKLVSRAA